MFKKVLMTVAMLMTVNIPPVAAQTTTKLSLLFRNIYGPNGLVVDSKALLPDGSTHSGHFNSGFQSEFSQFNVALASQLTALPLPSPASGFTYDFDASTGTFRRSTQSFGPILAERAETIGKGKLSFGLNYQHFAFDSIEGINLSRVPAVFVHDEYEIGGGRADVVTTANTIEASVGQLTPFLTYGLTNRIDISVAVPVVHTSLDVVSDATIHRIGTAGDPEVHFFRDPSAPDGVGSQRQFYASGEATGMGDIILRAKGTILREHFVGIAVGADLRTPTGDEEDLLGAGALGVKPFVAVSFLIDRISPHANLAYQWNGKSELAGDVNAQGKADLPDHFLYVAGADIGVSPKLTLAFDFFGQEVRGTQRLFARTFTATDGTVSETFPDIGFRKETYTQAYGSVGVKTNVGNNLLVNFNVEFRLNKTGLQAKAVPLIGLEYSF